MVAPDPRCKAQKRAPLRRFTRMASSCIAVAAVAMLGCETASGNRVEGALTAGPGVLSADHLAESVMDSPLGDYLAGNFALEKGEITDAATFFEKALADQPDNIELRRQVFLLDLADGRYEAAVEEARQLMSQDLADEDVQLLMALDRVKAKDFGEVPVMLEGLDDRGIVGLAAPFVEAWARFGAGGNKAIEEAITRIKTGESLGPLNDYHVALIYDLGGRSADALAELEKLVPESGPVPTRILRAYADLLIREGDRDKALELLRAQTAQRDDVVLSSLLADAEAGDPLDRPVTNAASGIADALLGIAEALQQERGSSRAVLYARQALFLQPDLAAASLLIGDIMAEQENLDAAIRTYESIDPASPAGYPARLRKAAALHEAEQPEEAFGLLEEIAETDGKRTDALVQLGNLLRRDENYERAEVAYSRAIERLQRIEPEHWTLYYARGITYERTKRWPEAEADFLYALELEPEQPFVLNYLGYRWVDMGMNLAEAQDMLKRAVELRPDDGFIVDSMGWVHYRLGQHEKAVDELERAVELEPGDPVINDHLGDAYWQVGREREAVFQWQRALTLDPEPDLRVAIRKKLEDGLEKDRS
jgi:tetratricopeptide (TPR) repeat protein